MKVLAVLAAAFLIAGVTPRSEARLHPKKAIAALAKKVRSPVKKINKSLRSRLKLVRKARLVYKARLVHKGRVAPGWQRPVIDPDPPLRPGLRPKAIVTKGRRAPVWQRRFGDPDPPPRL